MSSDCEQWAHTCFGDLKTFSGVSIRRWPKWWQQRKNGEKRQIDVKNEAHYDVNEEGRGGRKK